MHTDEVRKSTAKEVLIMDANTFVSEIGLTSRVGSALKHYLFCRGMQLVVPEVVAEECERHLTARAKGKRKKIQENLQWLSMFCGQVNGWQGPDNETIAERAKALSRAEHLGAVVVPELPEARRRAKLRHQTEQPPSHKGSELPDCRIWEQCLDLLGRCHVVFVSRDDDFCSHTNKDELHPTLWAEAQEVAGDRRLTFHRTMKSLLSELESEIQPLPNNMVVDFLYESLASVVEELESNSGCRPKGVGQVKQTLLTTDEASVIEVRLVMTDIWEDAHKSKTMDFRLSGSCRYLLAEEKLSELTTSEVGLLSELPDGSVRAVKGSFLNLSGHMYLGARPIQPEPEELGEW